MDSQLITTFEDMSSKAQVQRAARQIREATERRDWAMTMMRAEGKTLREIGQAAGLTHTGVRRILRRYAERHAQQHHSKHKKK